MATPWETHCLKSPLCSLLIVYVVSWHYQVGSPFHLLLSHEIGNLRGEREKAASLGHSTAGAGDKLHLLLLSLSLSLSSRVGFC